ncbi:MAG: acyltransferase domain-containing protein, partial [bacterium]|nr:acyltransferase domain-containing protein [bacterium]
MGRELYEREPLFRKEMERCFQLLRVLTKLDVKGALYSKDGLDIQQPGISQVVIFIFEYALAKLLIQWGIKPNAMMGYSFGEYAVACLSGVFSLEDALKVGVSLGQLLQKTTAGAMLSVPLPRQEITPMLKTKAGLKPGDELSLAVDNGPSCIVAGSPRAVDAFEKQVKERKLMCVRVRMTRALHSKMMEPLTTEFKKLFELITLNKPKI